SWHGIRFDGRFERKRLDWLANSQSLIPISIDHQTKINFLHPSGSIVARLLSTNFNFANHLGFKPQNAVLHKSCHRLTIGQLGSFKVNG
ncbi:hypothetical protein D7Y13_42675, partial [Corallococcus praedator]